MIRCYLDDSGDEKDPKQSVVVVAGLALQDGNSELLASEWGEVLRRHNVTYFHCREAMHRVGTYRTWTTSKVDDLYRELIAVISDRATLLVASGVDLESYQEVFRETPGPTATPDAYHLCLQTCLVCVAGSIPPDSETLQFIIDNKPKTQGESRELFRNPQDALADLFPSSDPLTFEQQMKCTPGLQAADIIAWEARKRATDHSKNKEKWRAFFSSLLRTVPSILRFQDRQNLIHLRVQSR